MIVKPIFNYTIDDILDKEEIESKKIKNVETIKNIVHDPKINEYLYNGFLHNYEEMFGTDRSYYTTKLQDMLYRVHLLINYNFIERYGVIDNDTIKNAISSLIDNDEIDFFDAVSYDASDLEIVDMQDFDVRNVLCIRDI